MVKAVEKHRLCNYKVALRIFVSLDNRMIISKWVFRLLIIGIQCSNNYDP